MVKEYIPIPLRVIIGILLVTELSAMPFAMAASHTSDDTSTEFKARPTADASTQTSSSPAAESPEDKKKKEQQERLEQLKVALKNTGRISLAETLKKNPSLKEALVKGDDYKLADELGLEKNDPQLQQLKARYLLESDIKKFSDEFGKLEKKGYASTDYEKALVAETKKIVERHQPMVDLLAARTGNSPGALAARLESWDQLVDNKGRLPTKEDGRKVAEQMAGFLRSVGDREGLNIEIKKAMEKAPKGPKGETDNKLLGYFEMGTTLANTFSQDPRDRLFANVVVSRISDPAGREFSTRFLEEWPKHVEAIKEFTQLRDAAIKVGADGRYVVNSEAMAKLKEKFPTLNQEWANAVGDSKSLWGSGFDTTKGEWSFTARQNPLSASGNIFPPTMRATNSSSLQQFLEQNQQNKGESLSAVAHQMASQNRSDALQMQRAIAQPILGMLPNGIQPLATALTDSSLSGLNALNPRRASLNLDEMFPPKPSTASNQPLWDGYRTPEFLRSQLPQDGLSGD